MRRAHRIAHRLLWPLIAAGVLIGFSLALAWRAPHEPPPPAASEAAP